MAAGLYRRQLMAASVAYAAAGNVTVQAAHSAAPALSATTWDALRAAVGDRLIQVRSPWPGCIADPAGAACAALFRELRNPYFIGDDPALTQTLGWAGAWTSRPSAYAVAARSADDVAAAVNFARTHRLRIAVKGGGHSYLGTSNAAGSLLIWTRAMHDAVLHDAFVAQGCDGTAPQPAVTLGAGAMWGQAYAAVTTRGGRYVQGGGCTTVGVAGLVQSGGFGSFSKGFGTAAAHLLQAEVVTADGRVRTVNARQDPELFWALKGGGGGSFGVVTRLTLRTHDLPAMVGAVQADIQARSDPGFRRLTGRILRFARDALLTPHWGEQISLGRDRTLSVRMTFQGLDRAAAAAVWQPLFDWVRASPAEYSLTAPVILALPARYLWNPAALSKVPGVIRTDDRPGAPPDNFFWAGDGGQVGWVVHGYQSLWLPRTLLDEAGLDRLTGALIAASHNWPVALHLNKGLAGAPPQAIAAARDTATNPAVLDAFALAIIAGGEPPAYPGVAGHEPDLASARHDAGAISAAMNQLRPLVPAPAAYCSESDYFERDWAQAYWGSNAARLRAVKRRYDPAGLFQVHHGIGAA